MNKTQKTRRTHLAGEPRDQPKRRDDLPQFSGSHNKCLQCGGDHHTTSCMQRQSPSTNASTTGTGIPPQQHTSPMQEQPECNPTPMDPLECNPAEIEVNSIEIIAEMYSWKKLINLLFNATKPIDTSAPVSLP